MFHNQAGDCRKCDSIEIAVPFLDENSYNFSRMRKKMFVGGKVMSHKAKPIGLALLVLILSSGWLHAQYWTVDESVRNEIRKEKLETQLPGILTEYGISAWITVNRDPGDDPDNVFLKRSPRLDPVSELLGAENTFYPSAFLFTDDGERIALIEEGDLVFVQETGIYNRIRHYKYARQTGIHPLLGFIREEIDRIRPEKIGINISETEPVADGLNVGLMHLIEKALGKEHASRLVSAEDVIVTLWGIKLDKELAYIKHSAEKAHELMIDAFDHVDPGKTSVQNVFDRIRTRMKVNGWSVGWLHSMCPIVGIRPDPGLPPEKSLVRSGTLLGINAGILTKGYSNDLDRTAYVLREGETEPPPELRFMWLTLRKAVDAVVSAMKPGAVGREVDDVARKIITEAGFELYWYQTGHPVGVWVHDIGTYIGPPHPHYGRKVDLKLHEGEVFAIEPGIQMFSKELNGDVRIHLQEMAVVTREGGKYLIPPQRELYLIEP